jgi:hypothetical protein
MACEGAKPAPRTLSVRAGSAVQIFWEGATSELVGVGGLTAYNPWVHAIGCVRGFLRAGAVTDESQADHGLLDAMQWFMHILRSIERWVDEDRRVRVPFASCPHFLIFPHQIRSRHVPDHFLHPPWPYDR